MSRSSASPSGTADTTADHSTSTVPGAKVITWAIIGLAAFRGSRKRSAERRARADPFRSRLVTSRSPAIGPSGDRNGHSPDTTPSGTARPGPDGITADPGATARPGGDAQKPTQIPARGWWQVIRRALKESSADNVGILAGGIAYAAFLAIFPALIAGISLFGLVADPATVAQQADDVLAALPQEAQPLLRDQIVSLTQTSGGALGLGLIVSILLALWSASGGTSSLMSAINLAYDEQETRNFLKLRGTALLLTLGAIVFVLLTLGLVALLPAALNVLQLGTAVTVAVQVVRWVLLVVLIVAALAIVYRVAPDRDAPQFKWTSAGAVVATALWVLFSVAFSLYVNNFGSYNKTYGALAGVVILLLWLYLTSYIILLGAEINAESEKQTKRDTTTGPAAPMGERGAEAADTVADPPMQAKV